VTLPYDFVGDSIPSFLLSQRRSITLEEMIFMTHFFCKRRFLRPLSLVLGLMVIPSYLALAQAPSGSTEQLNTNLTTLSGGPLSLQQVALITLKSSPTLMMGKLGVQSARAGAQMHSGAFDIYTSVIVSADEKRPPIPQMGADEDTQDLTFALVKKFRTGISSTMSAGVTRIDQRALGMLPDTMNVSHLNLNITIPLLKGRGYVSAAADETAALLKSQAAELSFYHGISNLLLASTKAYWDYKAAIKNLEIQQKSEQRIQDWANAAADLGKSRYGDGFIKTYKAEISRIQGDLANKHRNTIAAAEQVNSTKGTLAVIMGIPSEQVANIGEPSEEFALEWSGTLAKLEQQPMQDEWVAIAKEKRLDILAAKLNQEASAVKLAKMRRDVLPKLDLALKAGRNAIELGDGYGRYVDALSSDIRGTDVGATLTFLYPLGNNLAKGQRDLANATHKIDVIKTNDLMRTIGVQVGINTGTLKRRLKESVKALQAVELYSSTLEESYNSSRNRLLDDPHIIFNMLDIDEKLTKANNDLVTSLQELAKAIAQLRFQTGTILIGGSMDTEELKLGELSKLPGM
jgi:outer membrane protein TolC